MVLNASEGGMNILRIWGGGVYLPQIFYDTCDEAGMLVYHDMMNRDRFSGTEWEAASYRHQVRRLGSHVSIAVWDGCNECDGRNVAEVVNIVASEDMTRPLWPSCPAPGWTSGVNRLTGIPDGSPFVEASNANIEQHGPYQHGDGWPAVNGNNQNLNLFDPMTPQTYSATRTGLGLPNLFTSEFGSVGWSSFESVSPTVAPAHWALHGGVKPDNCSNGWSSTCKGGNVMAERNYPCDSLVISFWGGQQSDLDAVGEGAFKKQLFQCILAQALVLKGYIEQHRSTNTFGLQIWQLNEIWPTGGWGTIEYGTPQLPGQVVGGRWKPAHHWLRDHLFTDVIVSCGKDSGSSDLLCYVKNDGYAAHAVDIMLIAYSLAGGGSQALTQMNGKQLPAGPGAITWFKATGVGWNY